MTHFALLRRSILLLPLVAFCMNAAIVLADTNPTRNGDRKWRIGYYEGGAFSDYTDTMRTLVNGLIELGWIDEKQPPEMHGDIPKPYWSWLSRSSSDYLSFRLADCYSADWDNNKRSRIRQQLLNKLKAGKLDLVIAMGTWAGQDLATNEHSVPTLVLSTSNPIKAGIIQSAESSGLAHVTARVDPDRYLRQIRMFHRIVGFKTLGVAYENTPDGRIYSALDDLDKIARERRFTLITCEVKETDISISAADRSCEECYRRLAQQADAIYVTALTCVDRKADLFAKIFRTAQRPSFSMLGSKLVHQGIMMSISSDSGYEALGQYNATKFAKILNGTQPGKLPLVFQDPLDVAVNLETVRQIGFDMPPSVLKIAAETYEK